MPTGTFFFFFRKTFFFPPAFAISDFRFRFLILDSDCSCQGPIKNQQSKIAPIISFRVPSSSQSWPGADPFVYEHSYVFADRALVERGDGAGRVATDVHQTFDVHLNTLAQVTSISPCASRIPRIRLSSSSLKSLIRVSRFTPASLRMEFARGRPIP